MADYKFRLWKNTVVGWTKETTRGTAIAVADADFFEVAELSPPTINAETIDWSTLRKTFTPDNILVGNITAEVSFKLAWPLTMTDAVHVEWVTQMTPLLEAAGLDVASATVSTTTTTVITPDDDADSSVSVWVNVDSYRYKLRGCTANLSWDLNAGEVAVMNVTLSGIYDGAVVADSTFTTPYGLTPQIVEDVEVSSLYDGTNTMIGCFNTLNVDLGNEVQPYPCAQSDKGIGFYFNSGRAVVATINIGGVAAAIGSGTSYDAELDTAFVNGTSVTLNYNNKATSDETYVEWQVVGNLTDKGPADVNGAHNHDLVLTGSGTAEGELSISVETDSA